MLFDNEMEKDEDILQNTDEIDIKLDDIQHKNTHKKNQFLAPK